MCDTHLVVDGLCGWRRSQRLVDPSSGVESHGLRRLTLGPETLWKHPLLIIEILKNTQKHRFKNLTHTSQVKNIKTTVLVVFVQLFKFILFGLSSQWHTYTETPLKCLWAGCRTLTCSIAVDAARLWAPLVKHRFTSTNVCTSKKQIPISLHSTPLMCSNVKTTYLTSSEYNLLLPQPYTCMSADVGKIDWRSAVRPVRLHNCQKKKTAWYKVVWCMATCKGGARLM